MSGQARHAPSRDYRDDFLEGAVDTLLDLFIWNAPDHEHTRIQARGWLEDALDEAFSTYVERGGDAAQGLVDA